MAEFKDTKRKKQHIKLFEEATIGPEFKDPRFSYEPLISAHPDTDKFFKPKKFLGKKIRVPIWISSITGGTADAYKINHNLARAAHQFGMGMSLGSCRSLLGSDEHLKDFDLRKEIGADIPFFANLGIAQVESSLSKGEVYKIIETVERLKVDGVFIHINPLQEWFQPEGDRFLRPPIETIEEFLEKTSFQVVVKEVGQGMGPKSLKKLMQLPLDAIDFAAFGGTNFSQIELLRAQKERCKDFNPLTSVGHTAAEMVDDVKKLAKQLGKKMRCQNYIISGGVRNFLDGFYLRKKLGLSCVYGQAGPILEHAQDSYEELEKFLQHQIEGLALAESFLTIKN